MSLWQVACGLAVAVAAPAQRHNVGVVAGGGFVCFFFKTGSHHRSQALPEFEIHTMLSQVLELQASKTTPILTWRFEKQTGKV